LRKYFIISIAALATVCACKKKDKEENTAPTIVIYKPAAMDSVDQKFDSTVIEFEVKDAVEIDTVYMDVLNPNGGSMYSGYFIVNDKTLRYKGYHKLDDGVVAPKTYTLRIDAYNSKRLRTVANREFILRP
jgi:hypothetical protein